MAGATFRDSKYYNNHPKSDIVRRDVTRDANCSAMAQQPWDGEFIEVDGKVGAALGQSFIVPVADVTGEATLGERQDAQDLLQIAGKVRMVWAHHLRTDRQANGHEAVTTIFQGQALEWETELFFADDTLGLAAQFPAGTQLTIIRDADGRGVLCPILAGTTISASGDYGVDMTTGDLAVSFAQVVETPSKTGAPANDDKIWIRQHAQPFLASAV